MSSTVSAQWPELDKAELAQEVTYLLAVQKTYGNSVNALHVIEGFQRYLAHRFSVAQVVDAMRVYASAHKDMPAPSEIAAIIDPPPPKVRRAEYDYALYLKRTDVGMYERGGYDSVVQQYKNQSEDL